MEARAPGKLRRTPRRDERGAVLVLAVAVLGLLAVFAVTTLSVMRLERGAAANHVLMVRARLIARGGLERAISELRAGELHRPFVTPVTAGWAYRDATGLDNGAGIPLRENTNPSFKGGQDASGAWSGVLGGQFMDLGDRYVLRVADTASQVHLGLPAYRLGPMLDNLGLAIRDQRVRRGLSAIDPIAGRGAQIAAERDRRGGFSRKDELRELVGSEAYDALADFVSLVGWEDPTTVAYDAYATAVDVPMFRSEPRAPINVNMAPWPVLVAVFAGVSHSGRTVSYAGAGAIADEIVRWRASADPDEGPISSWQELESLIEGLTLIPETGVDPVLATALEVNANPNLEIPQLNPDHVVNEGDGKADITVATTELTFMTMGTYEIESAGVVLDPDGDVAAEAILLAQVAIYDLMRITTQNQIEKARTDDLLTSMMSYPNPIEQFGPDGGSRLLGYLGPRSEGPCPDASVGAVTLLVDFPRDLPPEDFDTSNQAENGGDLIADGLLLSRTRQRALVFDPTDTLPVDEGALEFWFKLDKPLHDDEATPIFRSSQPLTPDTGLQHEIVVAQEADGGLRIRSERLFYDPFGGEIAQDASTVPYTNAATIASGLLPGKGVPNEWHHLRMIWADGTDHRLYIDGVEVPMVGAVPASEGGLLGRAPYEPDLRFGSGIDEAGNGLFRNVTVDDIVVGTGEDDAGGRPSEKIKNNNGHGNNWDFVDVSNPGQGPGGPNGMVDESLQDDDPTNDDDEMRHNGGGGSTTRDVPPGQQQPPGDGSTTLPTRERFVPLSGDIFARFEGAFPALPEDVRVGTLTWSYYEPESYEGVPIAPEAFDLHVSATIDGLAYVAGDQAELLQPSSGDVSVRDAQELSRRAIIEEARVAREAVREEAAAAREQAEQNGEMLYPYYCQERAALRQIDFDMVRQLEKLEENATVVRDEGGSGGPEVTLASGKVVGFVLEITYDASLAPVLNVAPAIDDATLTYMGKPRMIQFFWQP